ncbi:winged helix-turn-helix domain-containing protein [Candidatus Palauibacter sp.]|uniref:winged helix-turn-helix domain-containing protein n=1 Tax=Candidatus Palauibacter sp. TaxID=3101350 RepID=UPI003B02ACF5
MRRFPPESWSGRAWWSRYATSTPSKRRVLRRLRAEGPLESVDFQPQPGRVVTTEALLRQVWGRRHAQDTGRVRTALKKLREKLGDDAAAPTYIFTERGVGYRCAPPDSPAPR